MFSNNKVSDKCQRKMKSKTKLSDNLVIKSAGSDLYRIGLSLFAFNGVKRKFVFNPYFTSFVTFGFTLKLLIIIILHNYSEKFHLYLGDFSYFTDTAKQLLIGVFNYGMIAVFSQTLHLWYYWKGIEPTYLRPFLMMSGMISPESIGLTDSSVVERLMKRAKLNFKITELILKTRIPMGVMVAGVPLSLNATPLEFIFAVIPWVAIFTLWIWITAGYLLYQINYFSIICYYLKLKLKVLNTRVENQIISTKRLNITEVRDLCRSYDSIHREIQEINDNYWSQYLSMLSFASMITCNITLFAFLFSGLSAVLKVVYFYSALLFFSILVFILWTASLVGVEANKSYPLLNSLLVQRDKSFPLIHYRIKVSQKIAFF